MSVCFLFKGTKSVPPAWHRSARTLGCAANWYSTFNTQKIIYEISKFPLPYVTRLFVYGSTLFALQLVEVKVYYDVLFCVRIFLLSYQLK
jgi:hypothetical protein